MRIINAQILVWLFLFSLVIVFTRFTDLFNHYVDWDEAAMMTESWAMTKGQILYRDIYHIHPIFQFFIFIPFFIFFPTDMAPHAVKLFNMILVLSASLIMGKIIYLWFKDNLLSILGGVLSVFCLGNWWSLSSYGEFYILCPVMLAAYFIFLQKHHFYAGVLLGCAFFIKQVAFFDILSLLLWLVFFNPASLGQKKNILSSLLKGFSLSSFIAFLYPLYNGAFKEAIKSLFFYGVFSDAMFNAIHTNNFAIKLLTPVPAFIVLKTLYKNLVANRVFLPMITLITVGLLIRLFTRKSERSDTQDGTGYFLIIWFMLDFLGLAMIKNYYVHYLIQLIPPLIFILIFLLGHTHSIYRKMASCLLILLCFYSVVFSFIGQCKNFKSCPDRVKKSLEIADFIRQNSSENDTVFLFREESLDIYYLSERLSPNGIYMFTDMDAKHTQDKPNEKLKREAFINHLPKMIVYGCYSPEYSKSTQDFFDKIIHDKYLLKKEIQGSKIFELK